MTENEEDSGSRVEYFMHYFTPYISNRITKAGQVKARKQKHWDLPWRWQESRDLVLYSLLPVYLSRNLVWESRETGTQICTPIQNVFYSAVFQWPVLISGLRKETAVVRTLIQFLVWPCLKLRKERPCVFLWEHLPLCQGQKTFSGYSSCFPVELSKLNLLP